MHRDLPEMIARGYADVAVTWYHLVSYWARIFPSQFEFVAVPGAEPFFTRIALARVTNPLRPRAMKAFEEFFFSRARDVYCRYDFCHTSLARRLGSTPRPHRQPIVVCPRIEIHDRC